MKYIKLGDICNIKSSKRIYQSEYSQTGVPFYRGKEISQLQRKEELEVELFISRERYEEIKGKYGTINKGDLLITSVGTIGNTWVSDGREFYYKDGNITQIENNENINTKFLSYLFMSDLIKKQYIKGTSGTAQVALTIEKLNKLLIPDVSLSKQNKIVAVLDNSQALIDKRKEQIRALDELVKSRFIEMFGDPVLNPKGWKLKPFLESGNCKNGMNFSSDESGVELQYLGVGDFKNLIKIDNVNTLGKVDLNKMPKEDYLLEDGDIVFVRSNGNKALVGRCLAVYPQGVPTTYSGFCIRYRKTDKMIEIPYLLQVLKTNSIRKNMAGRGANIQNLNQQILAQLKIPVPSLELQNEFTDFVKQVDKLKFEMENSLNELEDNFNSLMKKAFKGELL